MPVTRKISKRLPKNWRVKVSQELAKQGIEKNTDQIGDIFKGRINDKKILAAAHKAMNKVAREYARILKLKRELKKK